MVDRSIPVLEVQEVAFGYKQQALLYDVSLAIQAGEMVGLLGPNGSGKTTLLRLLSGVLQPHQGRILLEGRELRHWGRRKAAQRIAVVPQELHMPFAYTVAQMVGMGRTPFVSSFWGSGNSDDREIIQQAMREAGVDTLAERIFNELSGGERQRVTIAMALAQQPTILLLDEPTSHLDIKYQIETLELVQHLNRQRGMTVIAAMHDLNLASRYFSRLLLFQRGIVADATPAEVLEPGLLSRVYGIDVQVGILRGAEHLSVLPPSRDALPLKSNKPASRVHLIAGGGSGELVMRALADAHIPFSAGALNIGDSDHTLALRLAEDVITEQPYTPISASVLEQVRQRLQQVDLLILCPAAIGPGNLPLFQEALRAARHGLRVILVAAPLQTTCAPDAISDSHKEGVAQLLQLFAARDYTGGDGLRCLQQLMQAGAISVDSTAALLEETRKHIAYAFD
ncbi:ABC transporter ATP-binding protein [Dictyobacter aurantiacus]|uniref:ABC transporter n=1 Tax=Dictyobacter aurantiacus TaxID=1936993 RepID=A0A401Z7W5_9CHLR|nr:ABC transporter ATP-binding protein [Dictyobacter aurantiacus]GCE02957.1 ABC transporter [Dictyobacter aurantiacus]